MRDTIEVTHRATLLRIPEEDLRQVRRLADITRVSQSSYLREAIGDLLDKYAGLFAVTGAGPTK